MTPHLLTLEDGMTRLTLAPHIGGSILDWRLIASNQPLLRNSRADALASGSANQLACYPLVPWSNRVGGGGFNGPDHWFALAPNSPPGPLPIHGSGWQQAWAVKEHSSRHACLQLDSTIPFAYSAQLIYTLRDGQLNIELKVTHQDKHAAWHGLGLHPYLPRTANTRLQAKTAKVWLCDAQGLPTDCVPLSAEWDFNQSNSLPQSRLDNCFTEWDGHARIIQPDLGYTLECQASGTEYCLVYCPPGEDFFCFEPVTHPVNAHHLPGHPGLTLLHKGQTMGVSCKLHVKDLSRDASSLKLKP